MKTQDEEREDARNEDPISGEPGSHPVGVGVGTTGGALAGAAVGALGGPVGAAVGGVAGAYGGKAAGEAVNPTVEEAYWRENHTSQEYADPDFNYDSDYAPAYRAGYEGAATGSTFDKDEVRLGQQWESIRGESKLSWDKAKHATRAGWERAERKIMGPSEEGEN